MRFIPKLNCEGLLNDLDSQLIFGDLSDALTELQNYRNSPVAVRRAFARFLTLSQQLTETMRKEFKAITGEEWTASDFKNWDSITDLFKKLRRTDYHEFPVVINVRESQYYVAEVFEDEFGNEYNGYIVPQVTWGLGDPFSKEVPREMRLLAYDENKEPIEDFKPEKVEYEFILSPRTDEIKKALESAGTDDVHVLSEKCFQTLKVYFDFYNDCIEGKRKKD